MTGTRAGSVCNRGRIARPWVLLALVLLAGCGQKGPLYLPEPPAAAVPAQPAPLPAQDENDDEDSPETAP